MAHFDNLIEEAAELPRMYGYAPKSEAMYSSRPLRMAAREKQFRELDTHGRGYITLNQWVRYAIDHIIGKYVQLPKDYLSDAAGNVSKDEFIQFVKKAVDTNTQKYQQLYYFLLRTFQAGDKDGYGEVSPAEFDEMIECAAQAPRRFGLAPKTEDMFKTDNERFVQRVQEFSKMNTQSTGKISFDEWLDFALNHIAKKVATV